MLRRLSIPALGLLLAGGAFVTWADDDKPSDSKIWSGVYTAAQAERGKADFEKSCSNCHRSDLSGGGFRGGPALRGDKFMRDWVNGSVNVLFVKLRDTMPADYPETVSDEIKIDVLAFLLQQNGFPAGTAELKVDEKALEDIQIVPKGEQAAPNFTLVRTVGCLAQGPHKEWMLTKTTEPVVTKDDSPTPAALKTAAESPLGTQTYELISAGGFKPESHAGQKVEARGLLYRESSHNLLNLTSLQSAGSSCN